MKTYTVPLNSTQVVHVVFDTDHVSVDNLRSAIEFLGIMLRHRTARKIRKAATRPK